MKAVLFDLDGTLLPTPFETIMHKYLTMLGSHLRHWGDPKWLVGEVMKATETVIRGGSQRQTNMDRFAEAFFASTGLDRAVWAEIDRFYDEEFPKLRQETTKDPMAREVVQEAFGGGYQVVIATNPLFPTRAIEERLRWAGIEDFPYALVTTGENMHYCKPNPAYYAEIAQCIGTPPGDCLMIGDDPEQDGPAQTAGMDLLLLDAEQSLGSVKEILAGRTR